MEWTFADGVPTISGNGEIPDYDDYDKARNAGSRTDKKRSPWYHFSEHVKSIVFNGYVFQKGLWAFSNCRNCKSFSYIHSEGSIRPPLTFRYEDLWDIDDWFLTQMPCMLQELKKKTMAYPGGMTWEEWMSILDRMIFCFIEMKKRLYAYENGQIEEYKKIKKEELELFVEYFNMLGW